MCQSFILTSFKRYFVLYKFYDALTLFIKAYASSCSAENGFKKMGIRLSPALNGILTYKQIVKNELSVVDFLGVGVGT